MTRRTPTGNPRRAADLSDGLLTFRIAATYRLSETSVALASVLRGAGCGAVVVVLLRPDGTYCVQPLAEAPAAPTPPAADRDAAHLGVARAALRELHERRLRDGVARRLLREAGVIED